MITIEENFGPEYNDHQFNVVANGEIVAYAHTERAAKWAKAQTRIALALIEIEKRQETAEYGMDDILARSFRQVG